MESLKEIYRVFTKMELGAMYFVTEQQQQQRRSHDCMADRNHKILFCRQNILR